ncbi:hypothetical protein [Thioalkalivibrio sp. ALE23]|uniref:hypothetical protein n=1 Tax=Thioalkalivibrio sp. ALE23 TaxID=1265495 RepID=UPI000367EAE6|nr:hypothetical protein [Thioalkalivibrio sp. ALE23]
MCPPGDRHGGHAPGTPPEAPTSGICELCGRHEHLTRHHLIPRKQHRRRRIRRRFPRAEREGRLLQVCRPCHEHIHRQFDEQTLAERLNTREALLAEPAIRRFVDWIAERPPGFRPRR